MSNSDLKNFAVFVNSKSATNPSTAKSQVSIPFVGNIASHDSMTVFKMSFVSMLFTNNFFNIRNGYNTLKMLVQYAAGRGKPASSVLKTIVIPNGFYDYDTLTSYLNTPGLLDITQDHTEFVYNTGSSFVDVHAGFGSIANSLYTTNPGSDPVSAQTHLARCVFQSATLGILIQEGTDLQTTPNNVGALAHSFIYSGVYLIQDSQTSGAMRLLGFYDETGIAPPIPDSTYTGYGIKIYSKTLNAASTPVQMNDTLFGFMDESTKQVVYPQTVDDTRITKLVPANITDLSGLDEMYVRCPQMRTQFQASFSKSKLAPSDVVAVIPLNVSFGAKMSWAPEFQLTSTLINTNISQLDFTLTNSVGELLDFQGSNWSITFFCAEEEDSSRLQFENQGTLATPLQLQNSFTSGTSYMQERAQRKRMKA